MAVRIVVWGRSRADFFSREALFGCWNSSKQKIEFSLFELDEEVRTCFQADSIKIEIENEVALQQRSVYEIEEFTEQYRT